ncbi:hypothetical protein Nepgr_015082 [Nepenthes gracilis]|uniref:2-hydroxyflavanone C-glucosyltransferase n=1 Tax=Nepenthes gracilis TaxID=150966 RepID=A0AAD3SN03_NEPGR|nr:hypothetical protein Nepgr_015082 [Nepenthes gracilis]
MALRWLVAIGNLFQFSNSGKQFFEYVRDLLPEYGPIFTLQMEGSRTEIIVSSAIWPTRPSSRRAWCLPGSRSSETPTQTIFSCDKFMVTSAVYGPVWRMLRRNMVQNMLSPSRMREFQVVRAMAMDKLIETIRTEAKSNDGVVWVLKNARFASFSIVLAISFGVEMTDDTAVWKRRKKKKYIFQKKAMDSKEALQILMLPWLAHGHISPFLELAKKLTKKNFIIYFCSTPINLAYVKKRLGKEYSPSIQLVELHLPSSPDLPPHLHTTNGLPPHLMPILVDAFNQSANSDFPNILKTLNPSLLIYDLHHPWAPALASSYNIPAVEYLISGACMASFYNHFFKNPGSEYPFSEIYLTDFERIRFSQLYEEAVFECMRQSSEIVLVKSFREIEGKYIDHANASMDKRLVPVGPLLQEVTAEEVLGGEGADFMRWLDAKDPSSTVFVSFGSEYFLSKTEMEEIANGLELSGVNFIWTVRFPKGDKRNAREELPEGFQRRVVGRGLIIEGWAPQFKLLGHPSVGGFVSHCGWSSVMEGMNLGVPVIAMPMQFDQPVNARLVAAMGVGVVVERDNDGRFRGEEVAELIRKVVVEKDGENVRRKAKDLSEVMRKKGDEEIDELAREFVRLCKE